MTGTKSLRDFVAEVERREAAKADFIVPSSVMSMTDDSALSFGENTYTMEPLAHSQLAQRLTIPKDFYDALPGRVPGLRSKVVSDLLGASTDRRMVRTLDGNARAFLSDSFKPWDHALALSAALPVLQEFPDLEVKASDLSPRKMYLQVTFPRFAGEVKVGDAVQYGLTITNSEVGLGNVNVETLLWRLVCSNGAISQSILRKRHAGKRIDSENEEDFSVYQNDTMNAELNSFRLRLRDLVRAALTDKAWEGELTRLRVLAGTEVKRPDTIVENVTTRYSLTEQMGSILADNFLGGKDFTAWGLVNAVTALSHSTKDLDAQYQYERLGADIIRLTPKDWEVLSEKAAA